MPYQIEFRPSVGKQFKKLNSKTMLRVVNELIQLAIEPRGYKTKKLEGYELYRIRVGDLRVIYEIDDKEKILLIRLIQKREKDTYK